MAKRVFTAFIVIVSFLFVFICAANAAGGDYYGLTWELDDEGALTISGSGDMHGFLADSTNAWRKLKPEKIVIFQGSEASIVIIRPGMQDRRRFN